MHMENALLESSLHIHTLLNWTH